MAHPAFPVIADNERLSDSKARLNEAFRVMPLPKAVTVASENADLTLYRIFHLDDTSNSVTLVLPDPAASTDDQGVQIMVKRIAAGGNTCTIDPTGSVKIDGSTTLVLATQYDCVVLYSDATQWYEAAST